MTAIAFRSQASVELGEDLTDDLGCLVGGQNVAALGLGHLGREVFDGVHSADEHVPQRLSTRLRIVERFDRRRDRVIGAIATACTSVIASWRPVAVETTGSRSGFCCSSHSARASS